MIKCVPAKHVRLNIELANKRESAHPTESPPVEVWALMNLGLCLNAKSALSAVTFHNRSVEMPLEGNLIPAQSSFLPGTIWAFSLKAGPRTGKPSVYCRRISHDQS